ncbi:hypothetical protein K435DRAFT_854549 [Dendrothele bispora CBS 962.96]|uniref:Uncharacterized protein n=1 Tax=Dendrothele bispora (strain CBS 962.96) TaxID=1314807 RepID=A0A4S8MDH6_DENBC|nr:hypothetical protein K435DRAFT_854549 [Dendrothele bispora CBS 962.96]
MASKETFPLPGDEGFTVQTFRLRIQAGLDVFVSASRLLAALVSCHAVIIGSFASYVALDVRLPLGLDLAVEYNRFKAMSAFLQSQGYRPSEESVVSPWRQTAHSVYCFRSVVRRRIGPSPTNYIRLVRLNEAPYVLYIHLLKSPTTFEMTYLTPSTWVTFYPDLLKRRISWYRWSQTVNQFIHNRDSSLYRAGIQCVECNSGSFGACEACPANNRLLSGGHGVYSVVFNVNRRRHDVYGLDARDNFVSVPVKWRFSVQCFNTDCVRFLPQPVRRPEIYFAPSSDETVESVSDELCCFKQAWIKHCSLQCSFAVLFRPDMPPSLVPVPIEPFASEFTSIDCVMAELWFPRPDSDVWSMESSRITKSSDDEDLRDVSYTLYVTEHDREGFDTFNHSHNSAMLLVKHTTCELLSFRNDDLVDVKRFVYEWLDPTLLHSDDEYAGFSDWYVDSDQDA